MATLYHEYRYDRAVEIGVTIKSLKTKKYWDGAAWVDAEPKPTPMVREPAPKDEIRGLDIDAPDNLFPPGDYAARFWRLNADGTAAELVDMLPQTIRGSLVEIRISSGVTGVSTS